MMIFNSKGKTEVIPHEKKTRQGKSKNTLLSATSRNGRSKKYKGQGKR